MVETIIHCRFTVVSMHHVWFLYVVILFGTVFSPVLFVCLYCFFTFIAEWVSVATPASHPKKKEKNAWCFIQCQSLVQIVFALVSSASLLTFHSGIFASSQGDLLMKGYQFNAPTTPRWNNSRCVPPLVRAGNPGLAVGRLQGA